MSSELPPFRPTKEFKYTTSPNPEWTIGQGIEVTHEGREWAEGEKSGWRIIDASKEDPRKLYSLLLTGIVPRPIAFVSTISPEGVENIAPYSWFNQVTPNPPVISFSCLQGSQAAKDTTRNIRSGTGFTVNIISDPWIDQANICATEVPAETSEWPLSGLTKADSIHVKAPRVKESAFSMECELFQAIDIHDQTTESQVNATLILGLIKYIHVRNDVINERGTVDPGKLKPVARMGGMAYAKVSEGYVFPRRPWGEVKQQIAQSDS